VFNFITKKTLLAYAKKYPLAANALYEWYHELVKLDFENFNAINQFMDLLVWPAMIE
jgi:mRNA interferase HigB